MFFDKAKKIFRKIGDFLDFLIFPSDIKCIFCGCDIPNFEEKPYCLDCEKSLPFNNSNRCLICAEPIENEATICDNCQNHKRFFKKAFCPFIYQNQVRKTILAYKDSNQRYLAKAFAFLIAKEIKNAKIEIDLISFIPLTPQKEKQRSFNQSRLLAMELSKILKVEVVSIFEKTKDEKAQKLSSFKERQEKMKGLYVLKPNTKLKKDQSILIVDDVITTCATINYCSSLISNKVKDVYVCAIARNKLRQK